MSSPRAGAGRTAAGRNGHPTVKPIALMRHLVRLVTPPGGLVLDPFTGSGSTGVAAMLEGFRFVGCELQPEYHALACRRIAAATREAEAQPAIAQPSLFESLS
jgi:site-specific DNA-methyltransferase (adenine-specific)